MKSHRRSEDRSAKTAPVGPSGQRGSLSWTPDGTPRSARQAEQSLRRPGSSDSLRSTTSLSGESSQQKGGQRDHKTV